MNIKPVGERIVIKVQQAKEVTKGGFVIPETISAKPQEGEVVAVGAGRLLPDGTRVALDVKVGDKVFYAKFAGTELKLDGVDYLILNGEQEVLAVIE